MSEAVPTEFTPAELETLLAIADTFIPSLPNPGPLPVEFAAATPSNCPEFVHEIRNVLPSNIPATKLAQLKMVLSLLSGRAGLVLTQHWTPLAQLPRTKREDVLRSWQNSRIPQLRALFQNVKILVVNTYLRTDNRALRAMGFPGLELVKETSGRHAGFPFEFTRVEELLPPTTDFDVVIVGSGSGGGVCAQVLAEAGWKVLVIEKGTHIPGDTIMSEKEGYEKRFERSSQLTNIAGDVAIMAGSTWGGGTTVNWAASLQTPAAVRADWVNNHHLPYFGTPDFQADLDAVCDFMGVTAPTHNAANQALLDGARKLGLAAAPVPQNTGHAPHTCNHACTLSCSTGEKKGGVNSWLISAATHGAVFATGTYAHRLTFSGRRVSGLLLTTPSGSHHLPARRIILSAGALHTPCLLLRSRLQNPHIGHHLRLHPVSIFHAHFPNPIHPWRGNILTSVLSEHANTDARGHGVRVETMSMLPAAGMSLLPWRAGEPFKLLLAQYPHLAAYISIVRDRASGRVALDPNTGGPEVDYSVSAFDRENMLRGIEAAALALLRGGADSVITGFCDVPELRAGEDVARWGRGLRRAAGGAYGSAHQMGSCRMGSCEEEGVVDAQGRVWGVEGLWCADASVLPSASGVNPMVTVMAVARGIARGIRDGERVGAARL